MKSSKCNIKFKWDAHVVTQKTSQLKIIAFLALIKFREILMRNKHSFLGESVRSEQFKDREIFLSWSEQHKQPHYLPSFCINSVHSCQNFFTPGVLQSYHELSPRHCEMNGKTLTSLL